MKIIITRPMQTQKMISRWCPVQPIVTIGTVSNQIDQHRAGMSLTNERWESAHIDVRVCL